MKPITHCGLIMRSQPNIIIPRCCLALQLALILALTRTDTFSGHELFKCLNLKCQYQYFIHTESAINLKPSPISEKSRNFGKWRNKCLMKSKGTCFGHRIYGLGKQGRPLEWLISKFQIGI